MKKFVLIIITYIIPFFLQAQPIITNQPLDETVSEGHTAVFNCEFEGAANKGYQWWKNPGAIKLVDGKNLFGSTRSKLLVHNVSIEDDSTTYTCECKDLSIYPSDSSWINSRHALLRVKRGYPTITYQPLDVTITEGRTAKFYCDFEDVANKGYQWWKNPGAIKLVDNENVIGSTSNTLTLKNVPLSEDGSSYTCECKNLNFYPADSSSINSNPAILNVKNKIWLEQKSNTKYSLSEIKFTDSLNGFAWGRYSIITTHNGGRSWEENIFPDSVHFYQVDFVNENIGWGVLRHGETSFIYKTENGGITWQLLPNQPVAGAFKFSFVDPNDGWIIGDTSYYHFIKHTSDGGITWEELPKIKCHDEGFAEYEGLRQISFISDLEGFILHDYGSVSGELLKTKDGGLTWNTVDIQSLSFVSLSFFDENNAWAILASIDDMEMGSEDYYYIAKISQEENRIIGRNYVGLKTIFGIDSLTAWIAGKNGYCSPPYCHSQIPFNTVGNFIYFTKNGGVDWTKQYFDMTYPNDLEISNIYSFDNKTIWAVGKRGVVLKATYTPDSVTTVKNEKFVPLKYSLQQNYPNPFNPTTTIQYTIPIVKAENNVSVQLKVYDILGREVATLVNKQQSPGKYSVQFNAKGLNTGIYFYTIKVGSFISTKKMLLIK